MFRKNLLTFTLVSLSGIACLGTAQAKDQFLDNRWYIAPFGTFIMTDGDRHSDDGWGGAWRWVKSSINTLMLN